MLAVERRNLILEKLQEEKRVVVSELSQFFDVSEETIRRDLDKLDKDGLAVKSYGGAVLNEETNIDLPFNVRRKHNVKGKQKIAEIIASEIHDGDCIMLDASSTAIFVAKALKKKDRLTVITNSLEIVVELSDMPKWTVIASGGQVKEGYLALLGSRAVSSISDYNVDISVVSCKGFDMEKGFTDSNESLAKVKETMLKSARKRVLAVDSSKFGKIAFAKVGTLKDIDLIVTDSRPEDQWLQLFEAREVPCIYPQN